MRNTSKANYLNKIKNMAEKEIFWHNYLESLKNLKNQQSNSNNNFNNSNNNNTNGISGNVSHNNNSSSNNNGESGNNKSNNATITNNNTTNSFMKMFFITIDRPFLQYYLSFKKNSSIQILMVNIITLFLVIPIIYLKYWNIFEFKADEYFESYTPVIVSLLMWLTFSMMCLLYFLVLHYSPTWFSKVLFCDECDAWFSLTSTIIFSRFLILLRTIVYIISIQQKSEHSIKDYCFDNIELDSPNNQVVGYIVFKIMINLTQVSVFTSLPFPYPFCICLCILELISQEITIFTCSFDLSAKYNFLTHYIGILLIPIYLIYFAIPPYYVTRSIYNIYESVELQLKIASRIKEILVFLSIDVKIPQKNLLDAIEAINFTGFKEDLNPLFKEIYAVSHLANVSVHHMYI